MKFSVTGRKFEGLLCAPTQNLTETQEYDNKDTATYYAESLCKLGYRVWLFERQGHSPMEQTNWVRIAEWRDGQLVTAM